MKTNQCLFDILGWLQEREKYFPQTSHDIHLVDDGSTSNDTRLGAIKDLSLGIEEAEKQCKEKNKILKGICAVAGDTLFHFKELYTNDSSAFDFSQLMEDWETDGKRGDRLVC